MIKGIEVREKTNKLPRRFSVHHGSTTLPLRYSDFCYRLQRGATGFNVE